MSDDSVKVAVRLRPFNQREKDRKAKNIIEMSGNTTVITNPNRNGETKKFTFDYSYWSHDGFKELPNGILEGEGSRYASQQKVFQDLGQGILDNAFKGYNCSLFAYGQTGSGKSYSMVGWNSNKGIVPITCDELFNEMGKNTDKDKRFEVTFSMMEIYNEVVRDLLAPDSKTGGMQVRQNPQVGFYVVNLKKVPVASYKEIEQWMTKGTSKRTIAATQMNATSSRAHTIITVSFHQFSKATSGETQKSSIMNLVDLAGSERADSTGATGDRLKEGAAINLALSTLGNVISALAENCTSSKKIHVPYRDSVLTKLLQNALGGNSKTVMIAALSPADINYDETLSTLRYADRAKQIKTNAVVNESDTDRLIRELKIENDRLKQLLAEGKLPQMPGAGKKGIDEMSIEDIWAQLSANQEAMDFISRTAFEKRLKEAQDEFKSSGEEDKNAKASKVPHLANLNEDPQLSGVILHSLDSDKVTIGRPDKSKSPTIPLVGLSISPNHAIIERKKKTSFELSPATQGSKTLVNGIPLTGKVVLQHKDRILFGSNHMFVFNNPLNPKCEAGVPATIDWEFSQREIAKAKGFQTGSSLSQEQQILQDQILEILPMISEVNAISDELNKYRSFDIILISAAAQEGIFGAQKSTKVMVKMKNLINGNSWLWERGKFINRRYLIQEMYQHYLDGEDITKMSENDDPFWEPQADVLIGTSNVFLQSLSYCLDFDDRLTITDYKGLEEGYIHVSIMPCDAKGKALGEDAFVDSADDLLNKPYYIKVTIDRVEVFKSRFSRGIHVDYRVFKDKDFTSTPVMKDTLEPVFKHTKIFTFPKILKEHLDYFENSYITFMIYGIQEDSPGANKMSKMTTKELRDLEKMTPDAAPPPQSAKGGRQSECGDDINRVKAELVTLQRKNEKLVEKEQRLKKLVDEWSKKKPADKSFDGFFRAVSALAHSSGTKFKANAEIITKLIKLKTAVGPDGVLAQRKLDDPNAAYDSKACSLM